nr:hypothetical protein [uncultured Peptostreptococcus sp.]
MKILGLIEQDLDVVTKEYVDKKSNEIKKAGYITTATADNKYQPKGNYQPRGDYAQKNYVDDKIKNCASKDDITSINKTLKDVDDFLKSINKNLGGN